MDNVTLQKIRELIDKNDKIGIAVGKNPTVDTMASALTLSLGLSEYGKRAPVASASQPLVEHSSLVGIDKVKSGFEGEGGGDLVVSFPYHEGEIEKVSYTIDSGYLNIVVKAGEQGLTFNEADVKFRRGGSGAPSLLFIVGTSRLSDLGPLFDPEALKNTQIVNIDNKPDNQGFGDVSAVMPHVASVSELIADLLYYLGIDLTQDMAQNLMNGIADGTNNMQDPRVSYTTFELVANLMKKGASRVQTPPPPPMPRPEPRMPQPPYMQRSQGQQPQPFPRPSMMPRPGQMPQRPPMPPRQNPPMPRPQPQSYQQPNESGSQFGGQDMNQQGSQQSNTQQDTQRRDRGQDRKPPSDWLQPKVYKGSSNV